MENTKRKTETRKKMFDIYYKNIEKENELARIIVYASGNEKIWTFIKWKWKKDQLEQSTVFVY